MKGGDVHTRQMAVVIGSVQPTPEAFASFLNYLYTGARRVPRVKPVCVCVCVYQRLTTDHDQPCAQQGEWIRRLMKLYICLPHRVTTDSPMID
jgi:hypothetical protein